MALEKKNFNESLMSISQDFYETTVGSVFWENVTFFVLIYDVIN